MIYLYDSNSKKYLYTLSSESLIDAYQKAHPTYTIKYTTVEVPDVDYTECYTFDELTQTWTLDADLYKQYMVNNLLSRIQKVADTLTEEAPYLLMPGVSRSQVDRYKLKYEKAKEHDTNFFESEALITGVDVETLINIVLQNGQPVEEKYNDLISKIEGFRRGCKLLTYGEKYEEAKRGIVFMKALFSNIELSNKSFLDYCAGNVTTIGEEDPNSNLSSVIDIIGYVPEEPN